MHLYKARGGTDREHARLGEVCPVYYSFWTTSSQHAHSLLGNVKDKSVGGSYERRLASHLRPLETKIMISEAKARLSHSKADEGRAENDVLELAQRVHDANS